MSYLVCEACGHEHISDLQRAMDKYNTDRSIKLLDINGMDAFAMYGNDGGLTAKTVFYLYQETSDPNVWKVLASWLGDYADVSLKSALKLFATDSKEVDKNGGNLGLPKV